MSPLKPLGKARLLAGLLVALAVTTGCSARSRNAGGDVGRLSDSFIVSLSIQQLARGSDLVVIGTVRGDPAIKRLRDAAWVPADLRSGNLFDKGQYGEAELSVERALRGSTGSGVTVRWLLPLSGAGRVSGEGGGSALSNGQRALLFLTQDSQYLFGSLTTNHWGSQAMWDIGSDGFVTPPLYPNNPRYKNPLDLGEVLRQVAAAGA